MLSPRLNSREQRTKTFSCTVTLIKFLLVSHNFKRVNLNFFLTHHEHFRTSEPLAAEPVVVAGGVPYRILKWIEHAANNAALKKFK